MNYRDMANWLFRNWDVPARAYNSMSPDVPQTDSPLGNALLNIHKAIDPVNTMGGYGGLLSMALGAAKAPGPELPETWYHGTPTDFSRFKPGKVTANGDPIETPATFFVNDPVVAEAYASREATPMRQSLTYGEANDEFYRPALDVLNHPGVPRILKNQYQVEEFFGGKWPNEAIKEYLPSDVAKKLFTLKQKYDGAIAETYTAPGARIIPTKASGKFMDMGLFGGTNGEGFSEAAWDFALRNAKKAGLDGVRFRSVVDTPTGKGDPADVLAVFPSGNVRSAISGRQMLGPTENSLGAVLASALQRPSR